jgi:SAM-dependent methyltransferase
MSTDDLAKKRALLTPEKLAMLEKRLRGNVSEGKKEAAERSEDGVKSVVTNWRLQASLPVDWESLMRAGTEQAQRLPVDFNFEESVRFATWFDHYCTVYIAITLRRMGVFARPGERVMLDELVERLQVIPSYRKLLNRWLLELVAAGFLKRDGERFVNLQSFPQEPQESYGNGTDNLVNKACESIPDIITGKKHAVEVFFTGGSFKVAEWGYQLGVAARYFNAIAAALVSPIVAASSADRELRILEIGAGIGGTTAALLPLLARQRSAYIFTDISSYFLDHARAKFAAYPFIHYDIWDINQDPSSLGFKPGTFDLILAANVLHCARFLRTTLQSICSLLNPGGMILILELTRNRACQMIFPGLLEGFSHFEDERLKQSKPLLSYEQWRSALQANGFKEFAAFPEPGSPAEVLGQHVMIARAI